MQRMEKPKLSPVIVVSEDGSHTLKVPELKERYHSHKGAIQESQHVFIQMGANAHEKEQLNILEIGFGTGLNVLMTVLEKGKQVIYHTLEPFPLDPEMVEKLNYPEQIGGDSLSIFEKIHDVPWEKTSDINDQFSLCKFKIGLQDFVPTQLYDLIYYDAFAPHAQPELWESWVWEKLMRILNPEGMIVTYCAKGQVRRDMQSAGFQVERVPGPPGKREMLRATKVE
jgi:tRNA U34 5-methylaminomethyl-2-thiouridine-forming methyltransferase MnmC